MSDDNKPEDISFDINDPVSADAADGAFDFGTPPAESPFPSESEFPAAPSGFLTDHVEEPAPESEAAAAVVETPKKKGKVKPEKKKKEKKEKPAKSSGPCEPMEIGAYLSLAFGLLALLGLVGINALIFTAPATPGIGSSSTMYYAIAVNALGLVFVAVPFLFWMYHKGLQLFDALLGVGLMAFVVGVVCLLTVIYRYDFTFKAAKTVASIQSIG